MIRLALIGCGEWGYNLFRNFMNIEEAHMVAVCDSSPVSTHKIITQYPHIKAYQSIDGLLSAERLDAAIIATPATTHESVALQCLHHNLNILIEKPMAMSVDGAQRIAALADSTKTTVMIGHTFLYNPAVRALKEYIENGTVGDMYYMYSRRLNLGRIRKDTNALWNFAPHDISIVLYLLNEMPLTVQSRGWAFLQNNIEDVVFTSLEFPGNKAVHIHASWLDPHKIREMIVVGSKKMIVYDDVSSEAKIKIYDKGAVSKQVTTFNDFSEFQLASRNGDLIIPKIDFSEPLAIECKHFIDCIINKKQPLTDVREGIQVTRILEAAQASLKHQGTCMPI